MASLNDFNSFSGVFKIVLGRYLKAIYQPLLINQPPYKLSLYSLNCVGAEKIFIAS